MKNSSIAIACAALLALMASHDAAAKPSDFPFVKEVNVPPNAVKEIASIVIDDDIYSRTDDRYANMRMFDQQDNEVRFLLRQLTKTKEELDEFDVSLVTLSFRELADNRIEIVLEKEPDVAAPHSVEVSTRQRNYEKHITVSGSNDQEKWIELARTQPIFDYSKYIDLRNNRVDIRPEQFRYYRVQVANITEVHPSPLKEIIRENRGVARFRETETITVRKESLHIERLDFRAQRMMKVDRRPALQSYATWNIQVTNNIEKQSTEVIFSMARQPVTTFRVDTPDSNFSRPVIVEGGVLAADGPEWRVLANERISRIRAAGVRKERLTIVLNGPARFPLYRLTIKNEDNPVLDITDVKAEGEVYAAFLLHEPNSVYRLFYGGPRIPPPKYDIADVLGSVADADTDTFALSPEEENASYSKEEPPRPIGNKTIFILALIAMVITLGWLVTRAVRDVPTTNDG